MNITRIIGIFLLLCCLAACAEKEEKPVLSNEQLSRIMADLFIADAATTGLAGFEKDSLMRVYFDQVLSMHHVTKEAYENDLRIIARDLPRMEGVVRQASELLNKEKKTDKKGE